ncbi:MAG TPA: glycosyltransferase [Rhizomicrobium sp.]|nr:glycosyltransferase [Rhizomicrobium sp.]
MTDIVVAIPTFRRPQSLTRLLNALAALQTNAKVTIVVADNDAERHEGFDVCAALKDYRWPLDHFVARERGIAQVRNALVERALKHTCDFVAMLDDDEWPEPQWLDAFLRVQAATGADALHGDILRDFETAPSAWAARLDGIAPLIGETGTVAMIEGSGNIIVRRACFEGLAKPCFDPAFALSGGEDRDFFERLRRQGRRFAWAKEAVVHAWVPTSRANLSWALKRAYRVGNSDMRVFLKHAHTARDTVRESAKIAAALLLFPVLFVILGFASNRAVDALRRLFRAAGKIAALRGRYYDEYAVTHGA